MEVCIEKARELNKCLTMRITIENRTDGIAIFFLFFFYFEFGLKINRSKIKMMIVDTVNNHSPEPNSAPMVHTVQSRILTFFGHRRGELD